MRGGSYTRVKPTDLSKSEVAAIVQVNSLLEFLQENHPSTLESIFRTSASEYDLRTLAPHKLTSLFIEEQYNAQQQGKTPFEFAGSIINLIPNGQQIEYAEESSKTAVRLKSMGVTRSDCYNCDCGFWLTALNQNDPCAIACNTDECAGGGGESLFCIDTAADNYAEFGECDYGSGFMNFLNGAVDFIGNIGNAIGWDNIWNSVWSAEADDDDNDTPNPYELPDDVEEDEGTNWGTIALIGLGVVAVGIGIYFVVRKK